MSTRTKKKTRILIIDDDLTAVIPGVAEFAYQNVGLNPELKIVRTLKEALAQLDEWAEEGHRADIVDADIGLEETMGHLALQSVLEWAQERTKKDKDFDPTPAHICVHSKGSPDNIKRFVDQTKKKSFFGKKLPPLPDDTVIYTTYELYDLVSVGEGIERSNDARLKAQGATVTTTLRAMLNEEFLTNYRPEGKEIKNTDPAKTKRVLIIDDDITTAIKDLQECGFQNAGASVELKIVRHLEEGLKQLETWKSQGYAADLVDIDYFVDKGGFEVLEDLIHWGDVKPNRAFAPKNFTMHSKVPIAISTQLPRNKKDWPKNLRCFYDTYALNDIVNLGKGLHTWNDKTDESLHGVLNKALGTNYATHFDQAKERSQKHILIVDKDLGAVRSIDGLFENAGIRAKVVLVRDGEEALAQLKAWAKDCITADVFDIDHEFGTGIKDMETILAWSRNSGRKPKNLLIHSLGIDDMAFKEVQRMKNEHGVFYYNANQLEDLARIGRKAYGEIVGNSNLREHLNQVLGTSYPVSKTDLQLRDKPNAVTKIKLVEAYKSIENRQISPNKALELIDPDSIAEVFRSVAVRDGSPVMEFEKSLPKALAGRLAFTAEDITEIKQKHPQDPVIILFDNFEPKDTSLLSRANGVILMGEGTEHLDILAANHGMAAVYGAETSRWRVEERDHGKALIIPAKTSRYFDYGKNEEVEELIHPEIILATGDFCTINYRDIISSSGNKITGELLPGKGKIVNLAQKNPDFIYLPNSWLHKISADYDGVLEVMANADTPAQIEKAVELGAAGIGLVRTEHMLFDPTRLEPLQRALVANDDKLRAEALETVKPLHTQDLRDIFNAAVKLGDEGHAIQIRLLDAPPDEFISKDNVQRFKSRVGEGNERGVQCAEKTPGLYRMQIEAIFDAYKASDFKGGIGIIVPLVRKPEELAAVKAIVQEVAGKADVKHYGFGTMVETLEAAEKVKEIAPMVDFINIGGNDLQSEIMGGIKRHDIAGTHKWMAINHHAGKSPFLTFGKTAQELVSQIITDASAVNPNINICVCGQQVDGDSKSIDFVQQHGASSISIPAREESFGPAYVMAGQAAVKHHVKTGKGRRDNNVRL